MHASSGRPTVSYRYRYPDARSLRTSTLAPARAAGGGLAVLDRAPDAPPCSGAREQAAFPYPSCGRPLGR
ncbi:hypothetical protein, partial [Streptomyces sp. MBT97]|uniref:hypothetical protein n=1 Tax=Streptomyces sp. MBT97 TaxID=2800411 RepID=UPI001F1AB658